VKKEKRKKEPKRVAAYGIGTCISWVLKYVWKNARSLVWISVLIIPLTVILHAFGLYLPSVVLNALETELTFDPIAVTILSLLFAQLVFRLIRVVLDAYRDISRTRERFRFHHEVQKTLRCKHDYLLLMEEEYAKGVNRAFGVISKDAPSLLLPLTADAVGNVFCFLLFSSVISMVNPWIIALLAVEAAVTLLVQRWKQNQNHALRDSIQANQKKLMYLSWYLPVHQEYAKDVRVYNYSEMIDQKGNALVKESIRLMRKTQNHDTVVSVVGLLTSGIRDCFAYFYLIRGVVAGEVSSAEFVLYFSAITQLSGFITGVFNYFSSLREKCLGISDVIEYLEGNFNRMNHGKGVPLPKGRPLSVEFRNVTYKYPRGATNVLEDISFTIRPGEKVSLVGLNGAGKTTLTLLMCGLLLPDKGEVLIDGHSTIDYNRDELYTLFSIVPQNYTILPTSIAENVAVCPRSEVDESKLWACLEQANIADRVRALKNGIDTGLDKKFDTEAANLSGGEMQRLLLARALYRSAEILILDEPTAALDPIAEDKMYRMYGDIASGATSVFISHRLASTRFCDRIYLLDGARFAECGTHEELMALGGKYKELFDVQSQYYKEDNADGSEE